MVALFFKFLPLFSEVTWQVISTLDKLPNSERMLEVLGDWMADYENKTVQQFQLIDAMRDISVTTEQIEQLIRDLTIQRVKHDSKAIDEAKPYPMNQSQLKIISQLVSNLYLTKPLLESISL